MLDTQFWRKYFRDYDLLNELIPYQELLAIFIDVVKPSGKKILDAGCGTGNLALLLSRGGAEVTGLDFSEAGLEIFRRKLPVGIAVLHDLTNPLPFPSRDFDAVVSNNTLYAITGREREAVFRELYRVLKPGGSIVISNIAKKFNPVAIYLDHLRRAVQRYGFRRTFYKALRLLPPTVRIFYWNRLIQRENKEGSYDFFKSGEQRTLLRKVGFKNVTDDVRAYSGQSIMNSAVK